MSRSPLDPALLKFPHVVSAREHAALRIDDLSSRPRFGCKGPGAPAWLAASGYSVPDSANSARLDNRGVLVARLATSEFLIEAIDGGAQAVSASLMAARPLDVYPVARQDLVVGIQGMSQRVEGSPTPMKSGPCGPIPKPQTAKPAKPAPSPTTMS